MATATPSPSQILPTLEKRSVENQGYVRPAKLLLLDNTELNEDLRRPSSARDEQKCRCLFDTPTLVFINYRKDLTKIDENLAYACWRCRLYLCESAAQESMGGIIIPPVPMHPLEA
jgi:hypothetical protein